MTIKIYRSLWACIIKQRCFCSKCTCYTYNSLSYISRRTLHPAKTSCRTPPFCVVRYRSCSRLWFRNYITFSNEDSYNTTKYSCFQRNVIRSTKLYIRGITDCWESNVKCMPRHWTHHWQWGDDVLIPLCQDTMSGVNTYLFSFRGNALFIPKYAFGINWGSLVGRWSIACQRE